MRRRTLIEFAALLPLLAALPAHAQGLGRALTPEEEQLVRAVSDHNSQIRTMVGRFLQIDTAGARIEGTFFLERPNKIRFRYNPPSREEIISVGRGFYVINRQEQTQYAYPQDRIPLRQFLEERIDLLNANLINVVNSGDYVEISLADDTPIGVVQVSLIFETATLELKQWTLTEPSGAQLTFSLYDVEKDVEIPRSIFYIDPTYRAVDPADR